MINFDLFENGSDDVKKQYIIENLQRLSEVINLEYNWQIDKSQIEFKYLGSDMYYITVNDYIIGTSNGILEK